MKSCSIFISTLVTTSVIPVHAKSKLKLAKKRILSGKLENQMEVSIIAEGRHFLYEVNCVSNRLFFKCLKEILTTKIPFKTDLIKEVYKS